MANAFLPAQPCSRIYLTIKAKKLKDKDTFSKSDPLCVVYQYTKNPDRNGEWTELGRTEVVWNCLNPEFATKILCDYLFEERQMVKFELYDVDSKSSDLSKHDFLGYMECHLAEIVGARIFTKELGGLRGYCGAITISAEEVDEGAREEAEFHMRASKLDRKDIFGSSDPFLRIYRIIEDGSRQLTHQTKHLNRTLNPEWSIFRVNLQMLCGGNKQRPFLIECWDHESNGSHQFIGSCMTSAEEILSGRKTSIPLFHGGSRGGLLCCVSHRNSGILHFTHFQIIERYTFLDFIQAGTQLDFTVAIDLTASNGDPRKPSSLHYISNKAPSQYEVAIRAMIDICQYYNKANIFNAFGFGAIIPGQRKASPIFNLNLSHNGEAFGLQGVLEAYHQCVPMVQLYGPTNFAPVVLDAAKRASETLDGTRYQASFLPLSIIIVGVGNEDFESMEELDSDDSLLAFEGRQALRDIVQFVPLRQFLRGPVTGVESERVMWLLAKEVLAEVPLQLTSYMELNRISPLKQTDDTDGLEMTFTANLQDREHHYPYPTAPPDA
ncbi:hypothetical protein RB195_000941 [Necator americanus]|uniref:C2 domain-containing protein n=1 Tax=Necator americanus TaxID=51031 RepID=A0ABR1DDB3_NECAM